MRNPVGGLIHFISFILAVELLGTNRSEVDLALLTICIIGNAIFVVCDLSLARKDPQAGILGKNERWCGCDGAGMAHISKSKGFLCGK